MTFEKNLQLDSKKAKFHKSIDSYGKKISVATLLSRTWVKPISKRSKTSKNVRMCKKRRFIKTAKTSPFKVQSVVSQLSHIGTSRHVAKLVARHAFKTSKKYMEIFIHNLTSNEVNSLLWYNWFDFRYHRNSQINIAHYEFNEM